MKRELCSRFGDGLRARSASEGQSRDDPRWRFGLSIIGGGRDIKGGSPCLVSFCRETLQVERALLRTPVERATERAFHPRYHLTPIGEEGIRPVSRQKLVRNTAFVENRGQLTGQQR